MQEQGEPALAALPCLQHRPRWALPPGGGQATELPTTRRDPPHRRQLLPWLLQLHSAAVPGNAGRAQHPPLQQSRPLRGPSRQALERAPDCGDVTHPQCQPRGHFGCTALPAQSITESMVRAGNAAQARGQKGLRRGLQAPTSPRALL